MSLNRREFILAGLGAAAAACVRPSNAPPRKASLRFGCSAITWGRNDLLAIQEISDLGYPGIQLPSSIVNAFVRNPPTLTGLLAQKHLTFVALSSGALSVDGADQERMLADHAARAKFLHDVNGVFLQVTDVKPLDRAVTADDYAKLAALLNDLGRRCAEIGVQLVYHPRMGTMGETPDGSDRILAATDPARVKLLLDVAEYKQGGGDPAAAIRKYRDRLALLHLKDVEPANEPPGYRFVELGRGRVDLNAVFVALDDIGFDGWAVVELDATTEGHAAKESAAINKAYLAARGLTLG